jgi:Lon protease-like protein
VPARLLPIFPLPLVLLPSVPLPLHIFEPRYRQMLVDCGGTGRFGGGGFGIVFSDGTEHALPTGLAGCVARIESAERLPDGRSNIVVVGTERFALRRMVDSPEPYHVGEVVAFADDAPSDPVALLALDQRVRTRFGRVARAAGVLANDVEVTPSLPADPSLLSFVIAATLDLDAPARQRMLESRDAAARLHDLDTLLARVVDDIEARAEVHRRASSNGHGRAGHA